MQKIVYKNMIYTRCKHSNYKLHKLNNSAMSNKQRKTEDEFAFTSFKDTLPQYGCSMSYFTIISGNKMANCNHQADLPFRLSNASNLIIWKHRKEDDVSYFSTGVYVRYVI